MIFFVLRVAIQFVTIVIVLCVVVIFREILLT